MTEFLIIRPGATIYDVEGRVQGALSVAMNVLGQNQVDLLADKLKEENLKGLWTSAANPCMETAEILGKQLNVPVYVLDNFGNWNMGLWQGMETEEQLHKCQPTVYKMGKENPWLLSPPEGEPLENVLGRVEAAYRKLERKAIGKIGIVAQDPLAGLIKQVITGKLDQKADVDIWKLNHTPGSIEKIVCEQQ